MLHAISIEAIDRSVLQRLIDDGERENIRLDYKRQLPGNSSDERWEFLRDVTSFANAEGGDLVYGMDEDKGVPTSPILGLEPGDPEKETNRLLERARAVVDPRLRILTRIVPLVDERWILILRIPRSLDAPHMITLDGKQEFHVRGPGGKGRMSVGEVRNAVLRGRDWRDLADRWRQQRVDVVEAGGGPLTLSEQGHLYVHLVPIDGDVAERLVDVEVQRALMAITSKHIAASSVRFTFDGLAFADSFESYRSSYGLLFNDGRVEIVRSPICYRQDETRMLHAVIIEEHLIGAVNTALLCLKDLTVVPPFAVLVTLADVKGARIQVPGAYRPGIPVDRDRLELPTMVMSDVPKDIPVFLRPAIDRIWQACGVARSSSYTPEGIWKPPDRR